MGKLLYKDIAKEIEKKITDGELKVGDKLPPERHLAEQYGVSRNVVRESLKVLNERGIVDIKSGKGVYVKELEKDYIRKKLEFTLYNSKSTIAEMIEVREILDMSIVERAIENVTYEDIEKLKEVYDKMEECLLYGPAYAELDYKFHVEIARCTKNNMLFLLSSTFYKITYDKTFNMTQMRYEKIQQSHVEHKNIIKAIENKDKENLYKYTMSHIQCLKEQLKTIENKFEPN
jgi:DNA-binding FadR family transcriptional regulator